MNLRSSKLKTFFTQPLSPDIWGVYRIAIALFCLLEYGLLFPDLIFLFGKDGMVIWNVNDYLVSTYLPTFGKLAGLPIFRDIAPDTFLYGFYFLFIAALLGMLAGWKANLMAFFAWVFHMLFFHTGRLGAYGLESFVSISLFYATFAPIGQAFTVRHLSGRANPGQASEWSRLSLRVLQLHLCIVYLASGVEKAMGHEWWTGDAIWYSLMEEQFRQFDFTWMAEMPWVAQGICWVTLLVETGYALFIWIPATRKIWLLAMIGLHIGIIFGMGLHLFGMVMILLNLLAFGGVLRPLRSGKDDSMLE